MLIHNTYLRLTAGLVTSLTKKKEPTQNQLKQNQIEKMPLFQPQCFIIIILERSSLPTPCCTPMKHAHQTASLHINQLQMCYVSVPPYDESLQ